MSYHSRSSNAITPIASTSKLTQSPKGFRNFIGSGGVDSVVRQNGNNDGVKEKFGLLESTNQFNLLEYSAICRFILSEPGKESSLESILEHLELYYPEFSNVSGWEQKVERYLSDPNLFRFMEKKSLKAGHLVNLYGVVEGLTSIIEEEKEEELVIDENGQISERLERELKVTGWVPTPWLNITIGVLLYIEHVHKTEG